MIGANFYEDLDLKSETAFYFYNDVMNLANQFMKLTNAREIGIRLEVVNHDSCKHFHVDFVTYRLITTYAGHTTHWVSNENVNRNGLGQQDNSKALRDEKLFHRLPPYSVAIMKGEKLSPGNGVVHRSPPIIDGQLRLILRMDALEFHDSK